MNAIERLTCHSPSVVIVLDILERFLTGDRYTYARLDGSTAQLQRQDAIDRFNAPNSDLDIFLLTTRSGGVGINLTSADTVILFDQDFNPQQDLQAISRAHRIGQTKRVQCFKLMGKDTCEEKILQTGKRKLVLDHVIIQRMEAGDDDADDVESILQFGARELFQQSEAALDANIRYTDEEIDNLLERTRADAAEAANKGEESSKKADATFAFARIWEAKSSALATIQAENVATNAEEHRGKPCNVIERALAYFLSR